MIGPARIMALPVMRCGCGRQIVGITPRCEVCADPVMQDNARAIDRQMERRTNRARIVAELDGGATVGELAEMLGLRVEDIQDRIAEGWQ